MYMFKFIWKYFVLLVCEVEKPVVQSQEGERITPAETLDAQCTETIIIICNWNEYKTTDKCWSYTIYISVTKHGFSTSPLQILIHQQGVVDHYSCTFS